jgi:hypothetical protein
MHYQQNQPDKAELQPQAQCRFLAGIAKYDIDSLSLC